jgi:hypothetical protein
LYDHLLFKKARDVWALRFLAISRAITVGAAYILVIGIQGITSSFVAIFVAMIGFDLMVAAPSLRRKDESIDLLASFKKAIGLSWTQVWSSLAKGLLLGITFGTLCMIGFPTFLGGILTVGLGYSWAVKTRNSFTTYVAILCGLAVFEQILAIETIEGTGLLKAVLPVAWTTTLGTYSSLIVGWGVGLIIGIVNRVILGRPYRHRQSSAYDPPLELRSFNEVVHAGEAHRIFEYTLRADSPLAGLSLAELNWRTNYGVTILVIKRGDTYITLPQGADVLRQGDRIVVLAPADKQDLLQDLINGITPSLVEVKELA